MLAHKVLSGIVNCCSKKIEHMYTTNILSCVGPIQFLRVSFHGWTSLVVHSNTKPSILAHLLNYHGPLKKNKSKWIS